MNDTAEKLGVNPSTIRRQVQTAKNMTPEAKAIIRDSGAKVTKKDAMKLSRLKPEQQKDAASQLAAQEIRSMAEYQPPEEPERQEAVAEEPTVEPPPFKLSEQQFTSFKESVAALKDTEKDFSCTPGQLPGRDHRLCTKVPPGDRVVQYGRIMRLPSRT